MAARNYPQKFGIKGAISLPRPKLEQKAESKSAAKAAASALNAGVIKGMTNVETSLSKALTEALNSNVCSGFNPKYEYSRKNGEVMGSGVRNIFDTGTLASSLSLKTEFKQTKSVLNISYSAPYAALVHEGGVIVPYGDPKNAAVTLPGRPWISATLNGTNGIPKYEAKGYFARAINEVWEKRIG